jgi:hypothetical protein
MGPRHLLFFNYVHSDFRCYIPVQAHWHFEFA